MLPCYFKKRLIRSDLSPMILNGISLIRQHYLSLINQFINNYTYSETCFRYKKKKQVLVKYDLSIHKKLYIE